MKAKSLTVIGMLIVLVSVAFAATGKTEQSMQVPRCQAVDDKGRQCTAQADKNHKYCWRHRGMVKSADNAWQSTKSFTTNVWQSTKSGTKAAWDATSDACKDACRNLTQLIGGEDAAKKKKK